MKAAPQTPIVASFTSDPVIEGEAAGISAARRPGHWHGLCPDLRGRQKQRMELLHDAIPGARKFALLSDEFEMTQHRDEYRQTAEKVGVEILRFEVKSPADYQPIFDAMHDAGVDRIYRHSPPRISTVTRPNWQPSRWSDASRRSANGARWPPTVALSDTAPTLPSYGCEPPTLLCASSRAATRLKCRLNSRRVLRWPSTTRLPVASA